MILSCVARKSRLGKGARWTQMNLKDEISDRLRDPATGMESETIVHQLVIVPNKSSI